MCTSMCICKCTMNCMYILHNYFHLSFTWRFGWKLFWRLIFYHNFYQFVVMLIFVGMVAIWLVLCIHVVFPLPLRPLWVAYIVWLPLVEAFSFCMRSMPSPAPRWDLLILDFHGVFSQALFFLNRNFWVGFGANLGYFILLPFYMTKATLISLY